MSRRAWWLLGVFLLSCQSCGRAADEEPKPAVRETAAGKSAQVLRFRRVSIKDRDDMIGGEAFSFLAPADWKVEGGVVWRAHPVMPAAAALRVYNPNGLEQLELFPTLGYSFGGMLQQTGFGIGANYLGNEVQPPVRDALAYLKERHLPRLRGNIGARFVKEEALPKLAEAARQADPPPAGGPPLTFTAGKVRIEYLVNGQAVEEDHYCVLNTVQMPGARMVLQIADKLTAMRAAKGHLGEQDTLLQTMIRSHRLNLQWYSQYAQLCRALTQAQMNRIRAAGELSRYISRTHNEISDMMRQSYEARQASQDRINKNWSQYMRGVDEYHDPASGRPVELPSGYNNAWVNGNGEYIVTDSHLFNPNVELKGNWQKLEKAGN